ncbi:MAG: sulfotransferase [Gammaproteobacteria bacterium]|nr:sulfotransferase [Gammaproteobacteria bacterium]
MLKWLNATEAAQVGTALADDVVLQTPLGSAVRDQGASSALREKDLQKFLQRFLQRVDRDARPLQLNFFRRAKLANSFKWRLLEKGVEKTIVNELTQALVLRLTANPVGAPAGKPSAAASARAGARNAELLLAKGGEHLAQGAHAEAAECYQQVLVFDPRNAVARNDHGIALAQLGRYAEAEDELRRAIGIRPAFPEAHFNLAGVLQSTGRFAESEMPLRRALKLKPTYTEARVSLAMSFVQLGRLAEAQDCYKKALTTAPRNSQALVGIGQIEALNGRFEAAEAAYRSALNIDPNLSYAWAGLASLRKMTAADGEWLRHAEEIVARGLEPMNEATLRFAMGKYCDDIGDFARAFRNYQRANTLQMMRSPPYDAAERSRFVDDLLKVYVPDALAGVRPEASDSERPVLVVGMPRSGTSLVEQIIASHPSAHGAGELDFWTTAVRKHESAIRTGLPGESLQRKLATAYLQVLTGQSRDALRVIDKAPVNSEYLGLIHAVFPRARIIYMRRDPIDTCLSCYFQQFSPTMNYATDLSNLAHYHSEHRRLMAHWRSVLPPESLLEVPYVELIAEQERWTRRILEFVGLPWDARCLDFHTTVRAMNTASVWQVRQKIYSNSVGRWRNYQKFIGPLLNLKDADS